MKRIPFVIFAMILSTGIYGCAKQTNSPVKNDLFTDEFFADVVEICDSSSGQVSGADMEPVIRYLKGLTLIETDRHLSTTDENDDQLYGLDLITFRKSDGTEVSLLRNTATMSGFGADNYEVEGGNLDSGLKDAFRQAL